MVAVEDRPGQAAPGRANLVVNGDAELVVACDCRKQGDQSGGRIKLEGAIDVPEVRDEITRVMEGGEKAFRLQGAVRLLMDAAREPRGISLLRPAPSSPCERVEVLPVGVR